jgi:hypothetical protein
MMLWLAVVGAFGQHGAPQIGRLRVIGALLRHRAEIEQDKRFIPRVL